MKTNLLKPKLTLLLFFYSMASFSQVIDWINTYPSNSSVGAVGSSVVTDASNNIYDAGYFYGASVTFGAYTLTAASYQPDAYIVKLDPAGNVKWAKSFGNAGADMLWGMTIDASANLYAAGTYTGSVAFGPYTLSCTGNDPIFLCKIDSAGNVIWARKYGGPLTAFTGPPSLVVTGMHCDAAGNIYTAGTYSSTLVMGTYTLNSSGGIDGFVAKFDNNGNVLWCNKIGGSSDDYANGITADPAGNLYVTGSFSGVCAFGPYLQTSSGNKDIFMTKLTPNGNIMWAKKFASSQSEEAKCIASDNNGSIILAGPFSTSLALGSTTVSTSSVANFICKLDTGCNVIWSNKYESGAMFIFSITSDPAGNVYSTGSTGGTTYYGTTTLTAAMITSSNTHDPFYAKLDANGNFAWAKQMICPNLQTGYGTSITCKSGKVYVSGVFGNTTVIDSYTLSSAEPFNHYVVKLGADMVGVEEINSTSKDVFAYPNPTAGSITLGGTMEQDAYYSVMDAGGREVIKKTKSEAAVIDLSHLPKGFYFLHIDSGRSAVIKKVVIQ